MARNLSNLNDFKNNLHKLGYSLVDYNGIKIPCLYVEDELFEKIMGMSFINKTSVDTTLNIYDDGFHVFVDISLKFFNTTLDENFLLYANETLDFFYNLSNGGILGLAPSNDLGSNIFFIQLPKKERAEKAFDMIQKKLKKSKGGN
jgi:hypothetical protein